ncbi:hypothetical protein [Aquimarina sp. Aq78]|uniref:hypothetical protein n=1 Tax=Aquimarina sp. Aq78 TaxID=1191889 RepID=UPI000D10ACEB|nr:hypothetical protein [Aquimarina sp. Aq78]
MKFSISIILLFLFILSCNTKKGDNKTNTIKNENILKDGVSKGYDKNGNLITIHNFRQGKFVDTSTFYRVNGSVRMRQIWIDSTYHKEILYNKSGIIKAMGNMNDDDLKIGKWSFFKEGKLDFIREYKIIRGKQYLNQSWNIDKEGDTIFEGSKFFSIQILNDSIIKDQKPLMAVAYLQAQLFKGKSSEIFVCLPNGEKIEFDEDFSNEREIKLDTFYNLQHDIKNQINFSKDISKPYSAAFGKWFKTTTGKKNIRGFIEEYYKEKDSVKSTKMYFDIPIYIKDK